MTGRIEALSGTTAAIRPLDCGACFGCIKKGCTGGLVTAENRDQLPLSPGQLVETGTPLPSLLAQSFAVFLPPLLGFTAGCGLAGLFLPGEPARAAAGIIGLFAAGALVCLVRRRFPPKTLPQIRRVIPIVKTGR